MSFTVRSEMNNVTVGTLVSALQEIERLFSEQPIICDCKFEIDEQTMETLPELTLEELKVNDGRELFRLSTGFEGRHGLIYLSMNSWSDSYSFSVESPSLEKCQQVISILKQTIEPVRDTLLASEKSLAKDWLSPEDEQSWKHLKKDTIPDSPMRSYIKILIDSLTIGFSLERIILFGSHAYGTATEDSDINLCIIAEVPDIDELERKINLYIYDSEGLDFQWSVEVVAYTRNQWEDKVIDNGSLASHITRTGMVVYDENEK